MVETDIKALNEKIQKESAFVDMITMEMHKVIIGQKHMIERLMIGLLSNGHILLEGVPGLAKTLAIKITGPCYRSQIQPDPVHSRPAACRPYRYTDLQSEEGRIHGHGKDPIFANFILADEINRSPAKVQSALLEAMQERQVTIGDETFILPEPFLVLATENPIEQEGTYPLPEAQVDRFMLKVVIGYPDKKEEKLIIRQNIANETLVPNNSSHNRGYHPCTGHRQGSIPG